MRKNGVDDTTKSAVVTMAYYGRNSIEVQPKDPNNNPWKKTTYEQSVHEMRQLFPHAKHLVKAIKHQDNYPFISLDKEMLEHYFQSHFPTPKEINQRVDTIMATLKGQRKTSKLSPLSRSLVDKLKKFPSQIKDNHLKPLFALPFTDDMLTIFLSRGSFIGDWSPTLTIGNAHGTYFPHENHITVPTQTTEARNYSLEEHLGRSPLPCVAALPSIEMPIKNPHSLHTIYFEEFFHYAMQAVFKNNCQPFEVKDIAGKKAHMRAAVHDLMVDGKSPNLEVIKKLGLESYMDDKMSFRDHLREGIRPGSDRSIGAEIVAKIAGLIEREGWDNAREVAPWLCKDLEKRVLPCCYALCKEHGIETPDSTPDGKSYSKRVGKPTSKAKTRC